MALYASVVGGNFPIYRQRWRLDQGIATASGTWHWPAFLLGPIWMMYRRMYRLAAMWVGLLLLISVVETLLDVPEGVSLVITIALSVTTGTFGNTWYLAHCQRLIAQARAVSGGDDARLRSELTARGADRVAAAGHRRTGQWRLPRGEAGPAGLPAGGVREDLHRRLPRQLPARAP